MDILAGLIDDWDLSTTDLRHLQKISEHFGLGPFELESSIQEQLQMQVNARLIGMLEDGMISDDEWELFNSYCDSLNINMNMSTKRRDHVEQARRLWGLQFGDLMPIDGVSVKLKTDETPFFVGRAKWYENRKQKGQTVLKKIGEGKLIMTDQRVLLLSDFEDNRSVTWNSVLSVKPYSSTEFELEKGRGKSPEIRVVNAPNHSLTTATFIAQRLFDES